MAVVLLQQCSQRASLLRIWPWLESCLYCPGILDHWESKDTESLAFMPPGTHEGSYLGFTDQPDCPMYRTLLVQHAKQMVKAGDKPSPFAAAAQGVLVP